MVFLDHVQNLHIHAEKTHKYFVHRILFAVGWPPGIGWAAGSEWILHGCDFGCDSDVISDVKIYPKILHGCDPGCDFRLQFFSDVILNVIL